MATGITVTQTQNLGLVHGLLTTKAMRQRRMTATRDSGN